MFFDRLSDFWNNISRDLSSFRVADAVDIAVVAVILYYVFKFIRDRRAGKLAVGIITLLLLLVVSSFIDMRVMNYLMKNVFQIGIIAVIILFQPELRAALEKVGGGSLKGVRSFGDFKNADDGKTELISAVVQAAAELAETKTGALIVFERTTKLGDMILTGTVVDSAISVPIIKNIFFKNTPLHDGAVIIRDNRLYAAGCLLPLSSSQELTRDLGTRHRAAIGMSENSDAVVLVVSEETGVISLATEGKLVRGYDADSLKAALTEQLTGAGRKNSIRSRIEYFRNTRSLKRAVNNKNASRDGDVDGEK